MAVWLYKSPKPYVAKNQLFRLCNCCQLQWIVFLGHLQENQEKHPIFNHQFHMFNPFLMGKSMVSGEDFSTNPLTTPRILNVLPVRAANFGPAGNTNDAGTRTSG
jgi:hypothetical protein